MIATQRTLLNTLRLALAGVAIALAAGPFFLADTQLSVLADFFSMLVLATMWNLLAGYADIVTIGQHAFVGVGAYAFYAFAAIAGVRSLSLDPARWSGGAHHGGARNGAVVSSARRLSLDWNVGRSRGADARRRKDRGFWRRLWD